MEALAACTVAVLVTCGVYLLLRARTFSVVVGLSLLSYAVNLFLFFTGRLLGKAPPLIGSTAGDEAPLADPLPQALVLTAIVIGFGMTAFVLILALRARGELGSDHVDGKEDEA
ncbi:multisubunit potassium/proton antiporter, PhaC subunit [Desulfobulbus propionicus DSM 2032]|jgi:multicomponent K+:H+ antiporter subunit C|uniref:Multisubunit potassium/proton antiporter, PhaC subunit n=1 Tax=Desulfobulbus propionicus (strain ATCC 33891 / DSM 2032 / VKM B-1956 / 1pr3) TaxID=577650 RepID=A0A7U4DPN3_DESPD|nr:Na+/H+ antiporter subunit C [Desulfobulbus propionicus]ADW18249.1 multisubunit potassium/proton antiporter, PhaC subunit [Desulfobulbus propionicus DSM 2032]